MGNHDILTLIREFFLQQPIKHYKKDQTILYPDETPPGVFFIATGKVKQYDISTQGNEVIVNIFKPDAFFPMAWAINSTPITYYYETMTDSDIHVAPREDVIEFIQGNNDVMYNLLSRLYTGSVGQQRRMAHMMGGNAYTRVLYELIIEARRFGSRDSKNITTLHMSETDLARLAGLSRETTSREINKLKRKGLVTVDKRNFIFDIKNLESLLNSKL